MEIQFLFDSVVVKAVPHKFVDEFCETSYTATANETHSKTMVCSCGRSNTTTENCVDADENRACDLCGGPVACKHPETTTAYVRVEGTETHTVTVTSTFSSVAGASPLSLLLPPPQAARAMLASPDRPRARAWRRLSIRLICFMFLSPPRRRVSCTRPADVAKPG